MVELPFSHQLKLVADRRRLKPAGGQPGDPRRSRNEKDAPPDRGLTPTASSCRAAGLTELPRWLSPAGRSLTAAASATPLAAGASAAATSAAGAAAKTKSVSTTAPRASEAEAKAARCALALLAAAAPLAAGDSRQTPNPSSTAAETKARSATAPSSALPAATSGCTSATALGGC